MGREEEEPRKDLEKGEAGDDKDDKDDEDNDDDAQKGARGTGTNADETGGVVVHVAAIIRAAAATAAAALAATAAAVAAAVAVARENKNGAAAVSAAAVAMCRPAMPAAAVPVGVHAYAFVLFGRLLLGGGWALLGCVYDFWADVLFGGLLLFAFCFLTLRTPPLPPPS